MKTRMMKNFDVSVQRFNEFAAEFAQRFMNIESYSDSINRFCDLIRTDQPKILELGCGPGNVTRMLKLHFPESDIVAIDLAPKMIEIARKQLPDIDFRVMDVQNISEIPVKFDAIMCSFCLPFLSRTDAARLIADCSTCFYLKVFCMSVLWKATKKMPGFEKTSFSGNYEVYFNYHRQADLESTLLTVGFLVNQIKLQDYPEQDGSITTDMILLQKKANPIQFMMRRSFLFFTFFLILLSSVFSQQEVVLNSELKITKLSVRVWVVTHSFPWDSNSLILKASDNEVVLIDTPYTDDATESILQFVEKELNPDKITVILTGFHIDNLGGTGCLLRHKIPVYGSDLTCRLIDERSEKTQQQVMSWLKSPEQDKFRQAYSIMKFEKPDHIFPIRQGLFLKKGDLSFDVYFPGESHSPDNLVVYIKELNLLFGGCMIKSLESRNLGFTGDANMREWPISVKKVQEKYANATLVIPHHGLWGDISLIQHTIDLLESQSK